MAGVALQNLTVRPHPLELERTERVELSSLGWKPRARPLYHARLETAFGCQRALVGKGGLEPPPHAPKARMLPIHHVPKNQKGRNLSTPALEKSHSHAGVYGSSRAALLACCRVPSGCGCVPKWIATIIPFQ